MTPEKSPIILTPPPPPPPPPPPVEKSAEELNRWYWEEAYRLGYVSGRAESPMVAVKRWWQSKTLWLGSTAIVGGLVLEVLLAERQMALEAFGQYGPAIIIGLGIAVKVLRWKTTTGIRKAP